MERMHYNVEPLRTDQEIDDFLWAVSQARYGERNRMIVLVGINTGLRMSVFFTTEGWASTWQRSCYDHGTKNGQEALVVFEKPQNGISPLYAVSGCK